MANRTREKLINVARNLFAHKGIENTTMGDIADASKKGRRTVYTYFKSKKAIYDAVIEAESENLVERLRNVYALELPPLEKLREFIILRFEILKIEIENASQPESVRSLFTRDNKRFDRILHLALSKERAMFNDILRQCMDVQGVNRRQLARLKVVMPLLQHGIDMTFMRDNYTTLGVDEDSFPPIVADFILKSLTSS